MRILIDECVDPRLKQLLTGHEVSTVRDNGWGTLEDGPLLGFAPKSQIAYYQAIRNELRVTLAKVRMGESIHIPAPQA